ncbi:fluoride efflux transporter CrcB [Prosthecochloris sp. HL-130-GSB]|jgi:fluoride exporter|uniref:fluoride efflux transporter CrcB n=1 Tax=Prosthecochloris sp. HL-130-GSB TaxID=1974213 RepID=UPI000A1C14FF|nr:fluoride efflux transporter CrcB [Prosthecochloris sp. HL-130-GSB]ARM30144.1 camphor resistance protein CrcB [Prosthecochloris sp. HL-130-GSB]
MQQRMTEIFLVGVGGFAGAAARYLVGVALSAQLSAFPFATLLVNLAGCLIVGVLSELSSATSLLPPELRLILATGFCGGFTTFSSYINETSVLLRSGELFPAVFYLAVSVVLGMICLYTGMLLARSFIS